MRSGAARFVSLRSLDDPGRSARVQLDEVAQDPPRVRDVGAPHGGEREVQLVGIGLGEGLAGADAVGEASLDRVVQG